MTIEIRPARASDIPKLLEYGEKFVKLLGFPIEADRQSLENTFLEFLENPNAILLVDDQVNGSIGGLMYPHFFNTRSFVCQEVFWWVNEGARKTGVGARLIEEFENIARKKGASRTMMISLETPETEGLDDYYRKLGYRGLESSFVKEL